MASTTVTPPAAAPAAAPSTPAPVSTPAQSTPTPSAPETQTPSTTPTEAPSLGERLAQGWEKAKASVPLEETTDTPAETTTPAEETTVAPSETVAPETETPTEETPAATTETPAEATEEFVLDDGEAATPAAFADFLNKNAEAKKALDAVPELKNKVMAALRRDTENREIRQYIPDVETAQIVTKAASTFQQIDNRFLGATTPEGAQEFLNHWVREAMIVGDDGKPKVGADGKYELHPALPFIFEHIAKNKLSVLGEQAKATGNERLQAAVDIINEALAPSSSAIGGEFPDELKPHADALKAQKEALDKREADAARQQRESQQATNNQSIEKAETKAAESVRSQLKPAFAKAGLTEFESNAALTEIGVKVDEKLAQNALYQSIYDSILLDPPSEAREKRLVKHMLTYANQYLGSITAEVLRSAKGGAVTRQADKQSTVDAQKRVSATDPRGTSITPSNPNPPQNPAQMRAQVTADLTKQLGRDPEVSEVMAETWKRVNSPKR